MIRLLGAITGSALALATLLVVVGIPQFRADAQDSERRVVTLPLPVAPVESAAPDTETAAASSTPADAAAVESNVATMGKGVTETAVDSHGADAALTQMPSMPASGTPGATPAEDVDTGRATEIQLDVVAAPVDVIDEQWYAFWSPFRSELAANGFVEQLQRVTGLDYRVVRIKPGVYEVAFAYRDDADIQSNLSRITAATGLEMPDG